jgi:hypothetical protein
MFYCVWQQQFCNADVRLASPRLIALITRSAEKFTLPATSWIPDLTQQIALFSALKSQFRLEANYVIALALPLMASITNELF